MPVATNSPAILPPFVAAPLEAKDVLQLGRGPLHADDFRDVLHAANAVLEAPNVDDQVQGGNDLFADGARGEIEPGHQDHRLQPGESVARAVGVDGGHPAVVTGVHRLQHVQGLAAADFSHDDPVRPHPQGVDDQIAGRNQSAAFDIRRPGLHPHHVLLIQDQFRRVFDGHDPLAIRDGLGKGAEQRGLSRAGAAGNQQVLSAANDGIQQIVDLLREHAQLLQVRTPQSLPAEPPNGERRSVDGHGGKRGVDAAAVGEPGVHHRRAFVDPPADAGGNPLDDAHQVVGVRESHVGLLQSPEPLDVHLLRAVDENVGDGRIGHQRRQRSNAEGFFQQVVHQAAAFLFVERQVFGLEGFIDERLDEFRQRFLARSQEIPAVQFIQQPLVQGPFDRHVLCAALARGLRHRRAPRQPSASARPSWRPALGPPARRDST